MGLLVGRGSGEVGEVGVGAPSPPAVATGPASGAGTVLDGSADTALTVELPRGVTIAAGAAAITVVGDTAALLAGAVPDNGAAAGADGIVIETMSDVEEAALATAATAAWLSHCTTNEGSYSNDYK